MDVKEAVNLAKSYIQETFADEGVSNVGLEEAEFDEPSGSWSITIGFSRPWDNIGHQSVAAQMGLLGPTNRSYKVITVDDRDKKIVSLKNRPKSVVP